MRAAIYARKSTDQTGRIFRELADTTALLPHEGMKLRL